MARSFSKYNKKLCLNVALLFFMLIIHDEIFSSFGLVVYAVELVVWIFKNLPKNY